ncbi:helix-turn-helix transcriptional regulator [Bradyrhizobium sp. 38]|uniref:helix-turn-helix domain-containing protein n=1 Tax=unclassified Bradyrhizobium TaxID=2631580 RepID=UPI001FFBF6B7|nr:MULTISPECIES: helix-turn-helix transcriptional regulator [unclassified Bradyrhizobium]MCK1335610.1 helix-turn-helix transcriptional regulator [Bradyrhizobium sp. 38]MCK1778149.1 helix-turn-helix transcriptional regulator [Bradyrhizobium sp. 132]
MRRYKEAFSNRIDPGLPEGWDEVESKLRELYLLKLVDRRSVARRLVLARRLAAFETALSAAEHFDWRPGTYYAHEKGRHGLPARTARQYASAFGVTAAWLIKGEFPSGLVSSDEATAVDEIAAAFVLASSDALPPELESLTSEARRGATHSPVLTETPSQVSSKLASATDALDLIPEGNGDVRSGVWGFPIGLISEAWGMKPDGLAMLALATDTSDMKAGDRVLVDRDDTSVRPGYGFAVRGRQGSISVRGMPGSGGCSVGPGEIVIGRIAGVFRAFPG